MPELDAYQSNLQRGVQLLSVNRPREAIPYIQAAITASPRSAQAFAQLARCYNEIPSERHKCIPAIDQAIALAPNTSACFALKAWFLVCQMFYRQALSVANQGLALDPNCISSLTALANAYTRLHEWNKVETTCRRVLQLNPNDNSCLNLLAQALRRQGRFKECRQVVAHLLSQTPNDAFGHTNAGHAALAVGDHFRANEHFLEALRVDPNFKPARDGFIASLRARNWFVHLNTRITYALTRQFRNPATAKLGGLLLLVVCMGFAGFLQDHYGDIGLYFFFAVVFLPLSFLLLSYVMSSASNLLILLHPIGRHTLTDYEKGRIYVAGVISCIVVFVSCGLLLPALVVGLPLAFLSVHYPLMKDRWLRSRMQQTGE